MPYSYEHPRPALAVDCVIFGYDLNELKLLLIKRGIKPLFGSWALPGGFLREDETLEEAAQRELLEETGISNVFMEQLFTFGTLDRDPRERVISVAYFALISLNDHQPKAATDASDAAWFTISQLPPLAFDHEDIFSVALSRLRGKLRYQPVGFELLPEKFTLSQLQRLYEVILDKPLDKRNFRKKLMKMNVLEDTGERELDVPHRAARYYRFDESRYRALSENGLAFDL